MASNGGTGEGDDDKRTPESPVQTELHTPQDSIKRTPAETQGGASME